MTNKAVKFNISEKNRVEFEMTKAQNELDKILQSKNSFLKDKVLELITHTYFNSMLEIDRSKLAERAHRERPRVDFYLKSIFFFIYSKLYRGDKVKGYEIIEELKDYLVNS